MDTLKTVDGLNLHLQHWFAQGAARGTVQIVHGLGEHVGRYAHVAAALNTQGWHVAGHDLRGHGLSGGARGGLADSHAMLSDVARVHDQLAQQWPGGAQVLLGHSMGGLIAARFVAEALAAAPAPWSRPLDALVLSSPALDLGMNAVQRALLAVLGPVAPNLALNNGLKPAWISRDAAVVKTYVEDPLVHDRVTGRLVRFLVDAGAQVQSCAAQWTLPTLLMWAGADRCVAPAGSAALAAAAPQLVLTAQVWPGLAHEIFNEPERAQVLARLTDWLGRFPLPTARGAP
jgi:alpha-beta hydrolase superfamily lysophospholipase